MKNREKNRIKPVLTYDPHSLGPPWFPLELLLALLAVARLGELEALGRGEHEHGDDGGDDLGGTTC